MAEAEPADRPLFAGAATSDERPLFPPTPIVRRSAAPAPEPQVVAGPRRRVFDGPTEEVRPPTALPGEPVAPQAIQQLAVVAGVVDGAVTVDHQRADVTGPRIAAVVTALALSVSIAEVVRSGRVPLLPLLVVPLLLVLLLVVAVGVAASRWTGVPVRRFRVRSVTGEVVGCVVRGELSGGEIRHGDFVQAHGRQARDGQYEARQVDVLSTPVGPLVSRVRGRVGPGVLAARWAGLVLYTFAVLIALWTLAVLLIAT